jgi:hypothetical protein
MVEYRSFGSRCWPLLGGDTFGIGRHFHCQILAAPCNADDVVTWLVIRSQEAPHLSHNALHCSCFRIIFSKSRIINDGELHITIWQLILKTFTSSHPTLEQNSPTPHYAVSNWFLRLDSKYSTQANTGHQLSRYPTRKTNTYSVLATEVKTWRLYETKSRKSVSVRLFESPAVRPSIPLLPQPIT